MKYLSDLCSQVVFSVVSCCLYSYRIVCSLLMNSMPWWKYPWSWMRTYVVPMLLWFIVLTGDITLISLALFEWRIPCEHYITNPCMTIDIMDLYLVRGFIVHDIMNIKAWKSCYKNAFSIDNNYYEQNVFHCLKVEDLVVIYIQKRLWYWLNELIIWMIFYRYYDGWYLLLN